MALRYLKSQYAFISQLLFWAGYSGCFYWENCSKLFYAFFFFQMEVFRDDSLPVPKTGVNPRFLLKWTVCLEVWGLQGLANWKSQFI